MYNQIEGDLPDYDLEQSEEDTRQKDLEALARWNDLVRQIEAEPDKKS